MAQITDWWNNPENKICTIDSNFEHGLTCIYTRNINDTIEYTIVGWFHQVPNLIGILRNGEYFEELS